MFKKLFLILIILVVSLTLFSENVNKAADDQDLISRAKEQGIIRVIVKVDVPNLVRLTDISNKFKTGNLKRINRSAMDDADLELSLEIRKSVDLVLHNLSNSHYKLKHIFKTVPFISMEVNENSLKSLVNDPNVLRIIQDKPMPLPEYEESIEAGNSEVSEPMLLQSVDLIGADVAWNYGLTGKGWYVAILDTGIRNTHDMFTGKNIIEQCYSYQGDCPNGGSEMSGPGSAAHYDSKFGGFDHGTHVSGIAVGNNQRNLYGVAKDADIIAIQVFSKFEDDPTYGNQVLSYGYDQMRGLEYVYSLRGTYNIAAANLSLGGGNYSTFCDEDSLKSIIDNLRSVGIATVIATGNDGYCGSISSPACISSAVSIGGTDKFGNEYNSSNWKSGMVDLNAPGVSILSSIGTGDKNYSNWNGTSMATPHAAGTWALFKQFSGDLSVDELLEKLKKNRSSILSRCKNTYMNMQIDIEKTLVEFIKLFPPANFAISQSANISLLQTEYLNVLTWDVSPLNDGKGVVSYKIYLLQDSNLTHLTTVSSNVFTYNHRNVLEKTNMTYVITSLNAEGDESVKFYQTIEF